MAKSEGWFLWEIPLKPGCSVHVAGRSPSEAVLEALVWWWISPLPSSDVIGGMVEKARRGECITSPPIDHVAFGGRRR